LLAVVVKRRQIVDIDDLEPRKKKSYEVGMDLSNHSVEELTQLIQTLKSEIDRISQELERKKTTFDAAKSIFKS